jgi:lysophospholipase L1-like esterase
MQSGDYLFIQFGINDGDSACPRHVGVARYRELLGVMAQAAKARGAKPVFVTPVAAITCSGSTAVGNRGFLTDTQTAATANGVPLIDLHQRSVALYNSLKLCPNNGDYSSGAVGAFFCNDHTHFETAGARQIAGLIATALREQGIALININAGYEADWSGLFAAISLSILPMIIVYAIFQRQIQAGLTAGAVK